MLQHLGRLQRRAVLRDGVEGVLDLDVMFLGRIDDMIDDLAVLICKRGFRPEFVHHVVVVGARDGEDGEAERVRDLHGRGADGRGAAPDEEAAALLVRARAGDIHGGEDADASSGDGHRQEGAFLERDGLGEQGGGVLVQERVFLEGAVVGVVVGDDAREAGDSVALLELGDALTDGFDSASDVAAEDGGVFLDEVPGVLDLVVDRVGGQGVVLDEELVGLGLGDRALLDGDGALELGEDSGSVGHGGRWGVCFAD